MLYTESSAQSYELMQKDPNIFQTVGLHFPSV